MPTYRTAVAWIVAHEPHTEHNSLMLLGEPLCPEIVATYVTVAMVSDLFGVDTGVVVQDVCVEHKTYLRRSVRDVRRERAGTS